MIALLTLRAPVHGVDADGPDPFAVQRIEFKSSEKLAAELARVKLGVLVQMPRAEFEEKLAQARKRAAEPKGPPRLVKAWYRAELKDDALVGVGEWKAVHPGTGFGLLPLSAADAAPGEAFNLALQRIRLADRDAVVAEFDDKTPALLLEGKGEHVASLEWSARSEARPEGLYFQMHLPPCPASVLELELPVDRTVTTADGSLVSVPPLEPGDLRRVWKIGLSGRSQVSFLVRHAEERATAPVLVRRQVSSIELQPDAVEARFDFELEVPRYGVRELICEYDPTLRPYEVNLRHLEKWDPLPPAKSGGPGRFLLRLREPLYQGTLQVKCLAPLGEPVPGKLPATGPAPLLWKCPWLRVAGAVQHGETLELRFHPELRVEDWQPGRQFRVTGATATRSDRTQQLTLIGGVGGDATGLDRPSAKVYTQGAEYRARVLAWWQPDADKPSLTLQVAYEVIHGKLSRLPVLLPVDWEVQDVKLDPAARAVPWRVNRAGRNILLVDLPTPLTPADTASPPGILAPRRRPALLLTVHLVPARSQPATGRPLPFPEVAPVGAGNEGALAISIDDQAHEAVVKTQAAPGEPADEGPWGKQAPQFYFPYHGQGAAGSLELKMRPARLSARCWSGLTLGPGWATLKTRLEIEAEAGNPSTIDVSFSAPGAPHELYEWRCEQTGNEVRRVESFAVDVPGALATLTARTPLQAACTLAAGARSEHVRLTLVRPLRLREPIVLTAMRFLKPARGRWEVPLPAVFGTERVEGEVTVYHPGSEPAPLETRGLSDVVGAKDQPAGRTFRYDSRPHSLRIDCRQPPVERPAKAVIDRARLTTSVAASGPLLHHFVFEVSGWTAESMPVRLPSGARPLAVRMDGHWLGQLSLSSEGASELMLPIPKGTSHRIELLYATDAPGRWPFGRVQVPPPELPLTPTRSRHVWCLAPDLIPLFEGRLQRLPSRGDRGAAFSARHAEDVYRIPLRRLPWFSVDPRAEGQEAIADAGRALAGARAGQTISLREMVEQLTFAYLTSRHPLVVDDLALREEGLRPDTSLTIPVADAESEFAAPWQALGLEITAGRHAVLLTTRRPRGQVADDPMSDALGAALEQAASNGHDPSGRYRSALEWLRPRRESTDPSGSILLSASPLTPEFAPDGWTEWEPLAGDTAEAELLLVGRNVPTIAGLALTGLLLAFGWSVRHWSAPWRVRWLALLLAVAGIALLWLPGALRPLAWWPFLIGCLVGGVWLLVTRQPLRPAQSTSAAAGVALLALAFGSNGGSGANPEPVLVYIVPGPAGAPEKQTVLVPPEFLERLRPTRSEVRGAFVTDAVYEGSVSGRDAEFKATFQVCNVTDEPALLRLPLGGVLLDGEVNLDGARTDPTALPGPGTGLGLKIKEKGRHFVELRFRVKVSGTEEDRNVQFRVPPVVQSKLTFKLPAGAGHVQALSRHGHQRVSPVADGVLLEADLGRLTTPIHLRWYPAGRAAHKPQVQYREAYLWDFRVDGAGLTALIVFNVSQGTTTELHLRIPRELEVRSVRAGEGAPARLRDWKITGPWPLRRLRLDFQGPIKGDCPVFLELVPRVALTTVTLLHLPTPEGQPREEHGYLAYRAQGVEVARVNWKRVTGIPDQAFAPFWKEGRPVIPPRDKGGFACTLIREGGTPPPLPVRLTLHRPTPQIHENVSWRLGPQQAEFRAIIQFKADGDGLAVLDLDLLSPQQQPVTVTSVIAAVASDKWTPAPQVRRWYQSGNHVQIWLENMASLARIELTGWTPLRQGRMELPCLRVQPARSHRSLIHLEAIAGQEAILSNPNNLMLTTMPNSERQESVYLSGEPAYGGICQVRKQSTRARARLLTFVEVRDRRLTFTTLADLQIGPGELRSLTVSLRHWDRADVELTADHVARRGPEERGRERAWSLVLQPGVRDRYRLTVSGRMPLEEMPAMLVPVTHLGGPGVETVEHWVVIAGDELRAESKGGLEAETNSPKAQAALKPWPDKKERFSRAGGSLWRVVRANEWKLAIHSRDRAMRAETIQVFLEEQAVAVADGQRWLHEARFWLRHDAGSDLSLLLPAPASVVSVSLDGLELVPLQPDADRLWLPLPGQAGVRRVRVCWFYETARESLDRPLLDPVRVEGASAGPLLGVVHVPAGWRVNQSSTAVARPGMARAAAQDLLRGRAQLRICQTLAETGALAALAQAQKRFALYLRRAERALELYGEGGVTGPGGISLADWAQQLQKENRSLAQRYRFEAVRGDAEKQARSSNTFPSLTAPAGLESFRRFGDSGQDASGLKLGVPDQGTPYYWQDDSIATVAAPALVRRNARSTSAMTASAGPWLVMLVVIWLLSLLPFARPWLRVFRWEVFAALGALGWTLVGPTPLVVLLLALWILGRLLGAARWLGHMTWSRTPAPLVPNHVAGSSS
jgi:hypothetical protein